MRVGGLVMRLQELERENEALRLVVNRIGRDMMRDGRRPGRRPGLQNGEQTMKVLDYLRLMVSKHNRFPTAHEITAHMGWKSKSSANDVLMRLHIKGYLDRHDDQPTRKPRYSLSSKPPKQSEGPDKPKEPPPERRGSAAEAMELAREKGIPLSQAIKEVGLV